MADGRWQVVFLFCTASYFVPSAAIEAHDTASSRNHRSVLSTLLRETVLHLQNGMSTHVLGCLALLALLAPALSALNMHKVRPSAQNQSRNVSLAVQDLTPGISDIRCARHGSTRDRLEFLHSKLQYSSTRYTRIISALRLNVFVIDSRHTGAWQCGGFAPARLTKSQWPEVSNRRHHFWKRFIRLLFRGQATAARPRRPRENPRAPSDAKPTAAMASGVVTVDTGSWVDEPELGAPDLVTTACYVTISRKRLGGEAGFRLTTPMRLRMWPCETKRDAHARTSVHLQFQEIPLQSPHNAVPLPNPNFQDTKYGTVIVSLGIAKCEHFDHWLRRNFMLTG
jgi:hypothetical protein